MTDKDAVRGGAVPPSNRIDTRDPRANMYGCYPCPKCGSKYRYQTQDLVIQCDGCGFTEMGEDNP
jgi:ribosomal protein L37AE/L43A